MVEGSGEQPTHEGYTGDRITRASDAGPVHISTIDPWAAYSDQPWGTEAEAVAAREREAEALDAEVKAIAKRLQILMLVDDEVGARAARAYDALTSAVFIPTTVWSVGLAIAWSTCGAVYGSERATRVRFAKPLREVLAIAAEIKTELGRAA